MYRNNNMFKENIATKIKQKSLRILIVVAQHQHDINTLHFTSSRCLILCIARGFTRQLGRVARDCLENIVGDRSARTH